MVNKAKIKEWVTALRSKQYEQCTGKLKNGEGKYCCLGVAEELFGEGFSSIPKSCIYSGGEYFLLNSQVYGKGETSQYLSSSTSKKIFGEDEGRDPHVKIPGMYHQKAINAKIITFGGLKNPTVPLSMLNDKGFTFEEIADIIEYNWGEGSE